jgi:CHAD domain-containing protein
VSRFPTDLLTRPAVVGARLIALAQLDEAAQALDRIGDSDDPEALHDFRVALRRLRTTLRAYRPQLRDAVRRKLRRRLRGLARATNRCRDVEVQLQWLHDQTGSLAPRERTGGRWLATRLAERRRLEFENAAPHLRRTFGKVNRRLRRRLRVYASPVEQTAAASGPSLSVVAQEIVRALAGELVKRLQAVRTPDEVAPLHAARLAAKRLRYVLEPLAEWVASGPRLVERLKTLQDLCGDVGDSQAFEAELLAALAEAAGEKAKQALRALLDGHPGVAAGRKRLRTRPEAWPGIVAVARLVRARRDGLFAALQADWLAAGPQGLRREVVAAATGLKAALPAVPGRPRLPRAGRPAWSSRPRTRS